MICPLLTRFKCPLSSLGGNHGQASAIEIEGSKSVGRLSRPKFRLTSFWSARVPIIEAFAKAGKNLTTDSFIKAMDTVSAPYSFTATKRLGNDLSRLSQITDGKWKVISEYVK